ncbi:MAG: hypothetical protein IJQ95_05550 [Paludibacteraceae bacterium]|nr:hypothetical protein [Paludibacteraceae bacterium]
MKKAYLIIASVLALGLTSCSQNEEVNSLVGNYTYKVSGVVTIEHSDTLVGDVHLTPETGTMTLTGTGKEKEVVMSFNQTSGDVYDVTAVVTGDSLYVRPTHRNIEVEVARDTLVLGTVIKRQEIFDVEVQGSGYMLSNGDVCLMLTYDGEERNDPKYKLSGKNIHLHCVRNAK